MNLHIHWVNASRTGIEKRRVEIEIEDYLIDHFGSAANAFNSRVDFVKMHEPPSHEWNIAMIKGEDLAMRHIPPTERRMNRQFKCCFMDD